MRSGAVPTSEFAIVPVERLDVAFSSQRWAFADERRSEIDAYWADLVRQNPGLWNGRVLMLGDFAIADGVFRGACFEVDYASFLSWQDWGFPDPSVRDCFAMGCIQSSDGAFLLGVMGAHTFNAGQIYFPCGTPDLNDIAGQEVDFAGSIRREVAEETGLDVSEFVAESGWLTVLGGSLVAHMKLLRARQTATELRERMLDHLASEEVPELADIRIVRSEADFDPMMPAFVMTFLHHIWSRPPWQPPV
jgi:8-oxo-dGTP pyrophosphatase MutT (NUDIX family)